MPAWKNAVDPASIAPRLRALLGKRDALAEKPMFGGICFMWRGHMLCGTGKPGFMFRVDPDRDDEAMRLPGAQPMVQGGRRMRGFFWVEAHACDDAALSRWLDLADAYVGSLAPRPAGASKRTRLKS